MNSINESRQHTDLDMIKFAEFCGKWAELGFHKRRGKWQIDDLQEITTQELLELYKKTLIPQLPSLPPQHSDNDLQNVNFGPTNNETKY
jgi:hypothetical protein